MFIVFEGCDHTGKTTQSERLAEQLSCQPVLRFPKRTTISGQYLNNYLKGGHNNFTLDARTSHFFFSANRCKKKETIEQALTHGKWVIADHYTLSGIVYTRALDKTIPLEWLCNVDIEFPIPDITFYLHRPDLDYGKPRELYERKEFQDLVKKEYELVSSRVNSRFLCIPDSPIPLCGRWIPINTSGTENKTFKVILDHVQPIQLYQHRNKIGTMSSIICTSKISI